MQGKGKFEGKNQGKTDDKVQGGLERATPAEGHMSRYGSVGYGRGDHVSEARSPPLNV